MHHQHPSSTKNTTTNRQLEPLISENSNLPMGSDDHNHNTTTGATGGGGGGSGNDPPSTMENFINQTISSNPEFFIQAIKFGMCFCGLQASYLTWGYMQELIMTTEFTPTERVPSGKFPSAAFCVFSNRFLAVLVALISVRIRKGAFFANNTAPLLAFTPCALSNTMSSWSQYASLKYVSFPVQTVFKSSKIIPVMVREKTKQKSKTVIMMEAV